MTRQEAIEMLKALNMMLRSPDGEPISDACDALGMAIEALSADAVHKPDYSYEADMVRRLRNIGRVMDRNEAIQIVKEAFSAYESDYRCIGENAKWDNIHEALDLAIEALRESTDKYTNATTNLYDSSLAKDLLGISEEAEKLRMFEGDAESATTTDCISRQAAIEVVTRAIRDKFSLADWYEQLLETGEEIEALIESLPPVAPKPVADCISRQQVTDEIKRWRGYLDEDMIERINTRMNMLPPVTPTERTGWIPVSERLPEVWECVLASVHEDYAEHAVIINRYEEQPSWSNGIITAWKPLPEPYKGGDDNE